MKNQIPDIMVRVEVVHDGTHPIRIFLVKMFLRGIAAVLGQSKITQDKKIPINEDTISEVIDFINDHRTVDEEDQNDYRH